MVWPSQTDQMPMDATQRCVYDMAWRAGIIEAKGSANLVPGRLALIPFSQGNLKPNADLWRAGLPALGCEAALKPVNPVHQVDRGDWFYDCFAAERGQARSPQGDP